MDKAIVQEKLVSTCEFLKVDKRIICEIIDSVYSEADKPTGIQLKYHNVATCSPLLQSKKKCRSTLV